MRLHILGAGATGGHLAVRLALAGHQVSVLARGAQLAAIRQGGLHLQVGAQRFSAEVQASDDATTFGVQDVVVVAVKATAMAGVAERLAPLIGPDTLVVFPQNGMAWWYPVGLPASHPALPTLPVFGLAEGFLRLLRPAQVVPGIVYSANEVGEPGVVHNNSPTRNALEIGALDPAAAPRVQALRELFEHAGIASAPVADLRAALWLKLVGNASASPLAVITGQPQALASDAALHEVFLRMVGECLAVAAACGYPLADQMDLSRWGRHRSHHKPSLLQDYELGRPMEIAEMVLAPVAFARTLGVPTPALDTAAALAAWLAAERGLYHAAAPG
jgi:2-dehydropantoate 2-reductase